MTSPATAFYPDAAGLLTELRARSVQVAIVSDIHFDIRPQFDTAGLAEMIDAFVLSFEHGFQKPDQRMFTMALEAIDVEARHALMVGDWYSTDGGAAAVGIRTFLLPKPSAFGVRGLDTVIHLVDSSRGCHPESRPLAPGDPTAQINPSQPISPSSRDSAHSEGVSVFCVTADGLPPRLQRERTLSGAPPLASFTLPVRLATTLAAG